MTGLATGHTEKTKTAAVSEVTPETTLEKLLAYHCAPAFAGIKPANLASLDKARFPDFETALKGLNAALNAKDIYLEKLCECERRALILVYRKKVLEKQLSDPRCQAFLKTFGYAPENSLAESLARLKTRLDGKAECFPHELGVFLGYPLRDIYGFIHHRDSGCLLVGEWKVYHNAAGAKKCFGRYRSCRKALVRHMTEQKKTLAQIFCAA